MVFAGRYRGILGTAVFQEYRNLDKGAEPWAAMRPSGQRPCTFRGEYQENRKMFALYRTAMVTLATLEFVISGTLECRRTITYVHLKGKSFML